MGLGRTVPILRMFDEAKAKEFYVDFLGFKIDWEHRFDAGAPLYMQDAFQQQLSGKKYKYTRLGVPQETPWGTRELGISDPFGNKLIFANRAPSTSTIGET